MKIVTIGGGTGTYQMLSGLKGFDITAIVSMVDSGGSSGVLRDEYGVLPPGDIRKSIIALSQSPLLMKEIFSYRFARGGLKGHNLGNLIITALADITGSPGAAIREAGNILNIKGRVLPVTVDDAHLCAELEDSTIICGETHIDVPEHDPNIAIRKVFLEPQARIYCDCKDALMGANLIIIGPGDLYTSIIPNLLVEGIVRAIDKSKAKKIYFCNIMTKHGETTGFKASDFVLEIEKYLGKDVLDYIVVNSKKPSKDILEKYKKQNAEFVEDDTNRMQTMRGIGVDLLNESDILRHDPKKLEKFLSKNFLQKLI